MVFDKRAFPFLLHFSYQEFSSDINRFGSCPGDFVLASQSILPVFIVLTEQFKEKDITVSCLIGVKHEANLSEPLLTAEEASNVTFVIEWIKKLDFYWHLDGKRIELTNVEDVDETMSTSKDTQMLQLEYNMILTKGRIVVVGPDDTLTDENCCMRNPFHPASRVPSYPEFPSIGIGRYDVSIKGHLYKNVPYVAKYDIACPYGMKDAIVTVNNKAFPAYCLVSVAFVGSRTLLHGEDPDDIKVKRSRFQWILDGKPAGSIPDELWKDSKPYSSFESLQNVTIWVSEVGLYVHNRSYQRCCMDLTKEETTSTTTNKL